MHEAGPLLVGVESPEQKLKGEGAKVELDCVSPVV